MLTIKSFDLKGEKMKRKIYERLKGVLKIELIKIYMKNNNLSYTKFAKQCNISVCTLKAILTDGANFNMKYLLRIAKIMNIKIDKLFN